MYELLWIFFIYSFIGWVLECAYAAFRNKAFVNRGVLGGPLCCMYGFSAVLNVVLLPELSNHGVFLFLGSSILFGACEWGSGKLLERIYHRKWWDVSRHKYHIDGYVSIVSAAAGGFVGFAGMKWLNPLFLRLIGKVPALPGHIVVGCLLALLIIDMLWTYSYILGLPQRFPKTAEIHNSVLRCSLRLNEWILRLSGRRLEKAFPAFGEWELWEKPEVFAQGCSAYKIFWLFVIGALLGDLVETVFCRITAGVWMSRSSLVWGPFSLVWGFGIAGATWVLYNYREKSDGVLFWFGTFLGGAFEYVCSVFTELVFGQVFWDYSAMPFNLGGRINLLYCFFWGIAAVVWLKKLYPYLSGWIEKIPMRAGKRLTWVLAVFMAADVLVSAMALARYGARGVGQEPSNAVEEWLDIYYDDAAMQRIYPNAISVE